MSVVDRFLKYVSFDTESSSQSTTTPSTLKQLDLAKYLKEEMEKMGLQQVTLEKSGIVYATLPSNTNEDSVKIGFIAHMDTSPDMSGKDVKARIIKDYKGETIVLNKDLGIKMSPKDFPSLLRNLHHDLIVTDGTTLLGADDKAGIAEILEMVQYFIDHPDIKHGDIKIAFTPDEEVGRGTENFDVEKFDANYAYTVDGGEINYIDYENFNAASCKVMIKGKSIHPGSAKGKMVNASLVAMEFHHLLPVFDNPAYTSGYEGFNHLIDINGQCEEAIMNYIIRNHDRQLLEKQKQDFKNAMNFLNQKYGYEIIQLEITDSYSNMKEHIEKDMRVIEVAQKAMVNIGLTPRSSAIRGGTDGANLTYNGLLCPNLGTGGYNAHGKYEYCSIDLMNKSVALLIEIVKTSLDK